MVTCENCGSDELELGQDMADGRKELICSTCGHHWLRGKARLAAATTSRVDVIEISSLPQGDASWGLAQRCIRGLIEEGARLGTPSDSEPFLVEKIDEKGMVLLLAEKHRTRIPWEALEGVLDLTRRRTSIRIGGGYTVDGDPNTLDGYLKGFVNRAVSGWVAVVMEKAGLIRINRDRPATVRLTKEAEALLGFSR